MGYRIHRMSRVCHWIPQRLSQPWRRSREHNSTSILFVQISSQFEADCFRYFRLENNACVCPSIGIFIRRSCNALSSLSFERILSAAVQSGYSKLRFLGFSDLTLSPKVESSITKRPRISVMKLRSLLVGVSGMVPDAIDFLSNRISRKALRTLEVDVSELSARSWDLLQGLRLRNLTSLTISGFRKYFQFSDLLGFLKTLRNLVDLTFGTHTVTTPNHLPLILTKCFQFPELTYMSGPLTVVIPLLYVIRTPNPYFSLQLYLRDDDAYFSPSSVCSLQIRHLTIYLPKGRIWRQPWLVIRATTVKELSVMCDAESADIPTESLVSQPSQK